jgi:Mn2+/Fe2+ NRAMP family transporter
VGPVWRQYLRAMGPGLVTGDSDDDPPGIATYSQAGGQDGLAFLWAALVALPLMAAAGRSATAPPWPPARASASWPSAISIGPAG